MKNLICLLLCMVLCGCFVSCSNKPEAIVLNRENISEYVAVDLTFGEVDVSDNESQTHQGKYYITCLATIRIKPKGDYAFTNTSVSCVLDEGGRWISVKTGGNMMTASDFLYDWTGSVQLDKEGYGETTVSLFCYADTYDKMHPSAENWECYALSASGTVTEK